MSSGNDKIIETKIGIIDCTEVERIIARLDGVAQVAVIGIPHARFGEAVHAIVVPYADRKITASEVLSICHDRIAGYKCPRSVTIRTEPLPRSPSGEIMRAALKRPYWQSL